MSEAEKQTDIEKEQADPYALQKQQEHADIVAWIESAEKELQDLRLRQALLEADFEGLLAYYHRYILTDEEISTVAKTNLLEYFTYELLRPLTEVGLNKLDSYKAWSTRRFLVSYQLEDDRTFTLNFKMDVVDERFDSEFMPLITIDTKKMVVTVKEEQVMELIRLWYAEKIFSRSQLSMINYDLNQVLIHLRELVFEVKASLLDNTHALAVELESDLSLTTNVLDEIFITTMESEDYDFNKLSDNKFDVVLNQEQHVMIQALSQTTTLFIDSNNRRRSLLDFFTHYPFLVPLLIR